MADNQRPPFVSNGCPAYLSSICSNPLKQKHNTQHLPVCPPVPAFPAYLHCFVRPQPLIAPGPRPRLAAAWGTRRALLLRQLGARKARWARWAAPTWVGHSPGNEQLTCPLETCQRKVINLENVMGVLSRCGSQIGEANRVTSEGPKKGIHKALSPQKNGLLHN